MRECVKQHQDIVQKVARTKNQGPLMHLVGILMKQNQGKADPVMIKHLLQEEIKKVEVIKTNANEEEN